MTANPSTTSVAKHSTISLPARELRDLAKATCYYPQDGSPFTVPVPRDDYSPLEDEIPAGRAEQAAVNAKALREIALDVLSEPALSDPDTQYAEHVFNAAIDQLLAAGRLSTPEYDVLTEAHGQAVGNAARAVAGAWLDERGSLPIAKGGAK